MQKVAAHDLNAIELMSEYISKIRNGVEDMVGKRHIANRMPDERSKAIAYHDSIVPPWKKSEKASIRSN